MDLLRPNPYRVGIKAVFNYDNWIREQFRKNRPYDEFVRDIVNFLDYIGEPMQRERKALGIRVIAFLLVLLLISWMLKKEIWKDVE